MEPVHIVTDKANIAPIVLLPGDPLRAKYIAENFLEDAVLVNTIRNMYAYTGTYKGVRVTVCGSGMGIPSVGIYAYELYHFYDVQKIIRIGTSGALSPNVNVGDIVLSAGCYSISTFAFTWSKSKDRFIESSSTLNNTISNTAKELNIPIQYGKTFTSDVFDVYTNIDHVFGGCEFKDELLTCEMEGFGLMHVARVENKEAGLLMTVSDSKFTPDVIISPEDRQTKLNDMIRLALESIIK